MDDKEAAAGEEKGGVKDIVDDKADDNGDDDDSNKNSKAYLIRYCTHAVPMERQELQ